MDDSPHHHSWINPEKARYYQVHLARDLFGDWTLRKVWGGTGSRRGRMHSTGVTSYADGIAQVRAISKRRTRRGYLSVPVWPNKSEATMRCHIRHG
jgi:hypothetical protein